ncbi:hypothetical protein HAX54_039468 [Datura stramonium]|uniref:Uncharacterized protein n=1 Tax=Datura stramonium TaxID=4076 RepID=A0ABS8VLC6_DATST|nr:hypothetical protein [Datura stramonium]
MGMFWELHSTIARIQNLVVKAGCCEIIVAEEYWTVTLIGSKSIEDRDMVAQARPLHSIKSLFMLRELDGGYRFDPRNYHTIPFWSELSELQAGYWSMRH